jgi:hypothetical protein
MAKEFVARNGIIALSNSTITGSLDVTGNLTTTGTITAQKLVVQQVTSSVVYSSGSNVFGNSLSNTQSITGSVSVTGSLSINGVTVVANSVSSFNTRSGSVTLSSGDVTTALGFTPYNATNPSSYITTAGARTALSFTAGSGAYDNTTGVFTIPTNTNQLTNGAGYTTNTGTVTSVGGTGTVSGLTLSGTVTSTGNLTLGGSLSLTSGQITTGLGYTPYNATNPSGYTTNTGTVTSVATSGGYGGLTLTGGTITTSGTITLGGTPTGTWPISVSGNAATATNLSNNYTTWNSVGGYSSVVGMLAWKNYGNNHVIFDASQGTSPDGISVNQTNSSAAWSASYPTLMGWNGSSTYGVRVDSARVADSAGSLSNMNISQFTNNSGYITGYTETDTLASVTNRGFTTGQNIEFTNGRKGLVGVYDAAQTQAIFAMGSAYVLTNGGASNNIGNLYGLAWSYNPNYGGSGNNPQSISGLNHQLLLMQAGVTTAAMGSGVWTSGAVYGTVFYDVNNTGYYVDPASTSTLYDLTITGASNKYLYINPGNGYEAMVRYNGGSGSSWYVGKRVTSQVVGTESFHFYSEAAAQTVSGIDTSGNVFSIGSMRSPIFYDSNDTGYYVNPASTSRLSSIDYGTSGYYFGAGDWGWRHNTPYGWIQFGPANSGHAHIYTSLSNFYFNAQIQVNGGSQINTSDIRASIFYDSNDTGYYFDGSSTGDSIRVAGDVVAYYSDERLKDIKENIPNAINKVLSLNGFYYEPNEIAQKLGYKKKLEIGLSAQEVERILPEIIKDAPIGHGYKTLDYGKLTPLLVEAIKEQQQQIEELKTLINNLTK